jgi:transposase
VTRHLEMHAVGVLEAAVRRSLTRFPDTVVRGDDRLGEESWKPAAKPPEFRRRAVQLARRREKPIPGIAQDLGIAESCLRGWLKQGDVDSGRVEVISTDERAELVRLRVAEIEILERAGACFARENVLSKWRPGCPGACRRRHRRRGGLPGAAGLAVGLLRVAGRPASARGGVQPVPAR